MNNELIVEQVTDGSTVTRKWLGFTNREILFPVVGAVGSTMLIMLYNIGMPLKFIVPVIPVPFVSSLIILFVLVYKKPPHYAEDLLNETCYGGAYCPYSKKFSYAPDGMFVDDVIIWGDLGNGSWSCGLSLLIPPMDYSRNEDKNNLKHRIDSMLNFFAKENLRVQFYWSVGDKYLELQDYDRQTDTLPAESLCYRYRKERSNEYENQLSGRELRREELYIFISSEISEQLSGNLSNDTYGRASDELLKNIKTHARQQLNRASSFFETIGIASRRLNTLELCSLVRKYYNPSYAYAPVKDNFDENLSIKENCIFSDITESSEFSMVLDNQHVCVYALQAPLPKQVYPGMINELTKLGILGYSITVNIVPQNLDKAINQEESALRVLENQMQQKKAPHTLELAYNRRREMLEELGDGRSSPVDMQIIISVNATSVDEMQIKSTAIKASLTNFNIGYYMLSETRGAINAYFQATPGWLYGKRPKHSFRTLSKYASSLIPFSSTYTGNLLNAEAIYNGEEGNLVGIKQFAGAVNEDSDPQHSIIFGKTGSGKSVLTADLIMQTHGFYHYTCIIDYGLSYQDLANSLGYKPIRLGPGCSITINYFDTNKLPLTGEHLSMVATILRVMAREKVSEGMIMRYLKPFYLEYAEEWLANNSKHLHQLATIAILQEKYLKERQVDDETEAYLKALNEWETAAYDAETVSEYMFEVEGRERILMQCFAFFEPEGFPTHTEFVSYLRSRPMPEEEDSKGLQDVSDIFELWCAGGKNGSLFDGITNIKLDGGFDYFELSSVPDNDPDFKFVVGALIQMSAMSKIERLPRNLKKRLVIDEANSFFEIPQGAKVIESAMTKYRKHRCAVLISFQQYEMLNNKDIKESVLSNIHQYILLGQSDRGDVERLGEALGLSGAIKEAVLNFETPANLPEKERYAAFAQVTKKDGLTAGIGRNYLNREMIEILSNHNQKQETEK
jgi:type IV secretory pathway VirB4 component